MAPSPMDKARKGNGQPSSSATRLGPPPRRQFAIPDTSDPVVDPARATEDRAMSKALDAVVGAMLAEENKAEKGFLSGNAAKMPGSWYNGGGSANPGLLARVSQNLEAAFGRAPAELETALTRAGMDWGSPFPPGRPLDPNWGYRRPPRTWDYSVGENVQLTPRSNRISFGTLKSIIESYDVAQVCIRHLINDVRSLDYHFEPPTNVIEDATDDIDAAERFWSHPDRRQPFRAWVAELLQDVLRYDAGTLYVRRDQKGTPLALEVVSGPTIIPLIDFFGRRPEDEDELTTAGKLIEGMGGQWDGKVVPAYLQIIEGMPWDWMAAEDIIYQPWNPMPDSQYGLAPMEAVLLSANSSIRYQWHILQYFTEGTLPQGFMEAPPELSDPNQVAEWQNTWDALMLGDQAKLRQIRWVPAGAKYVPAKPTTFEENFPLVFDRRTMASFGVTPNDLGWTEDVNRSTGDTQIDVQFRVGTLPLVRHIEDIVNGFTERELKLKARIKIDTGKEVEDRLATAQADHIYIQAGVISADEVRQKLGKRTSRERPTPRFIDNTRAGPIPLLALESLGGDTDPSTFGPSQKQGLIEHPFVSAPGVAPVIGSASHGQSMNATEAMQYNMIQGNADNRARGKVVHPDGTVQTSPMAPASVLQAKLAAKPDPKPAAKGLSEEACDIINHLLDKLAAKEETAGMTAATGVQGSDLIGDEEDEDTKLVKQWRKNALARVKKGQSPRRFDDAPAHISGLVWPKLATAETVEEVNAAFAALKDLAPMGG